MSQRNQSESAFRSRSPPRTDRPQGIEREQPYRTQHTERQLHGDSPTRHDVEFYVRKVNRLEAQIARVEHELSVAKFRLVKAQDLEGKYDLLFKDNQKTLSDLIETRQLLQESEKLVDRLDIDYGQANAQIKTLKAEVEAERKIGEQLRQKKEELRSQSTSQGQEEREALKEAFTKEIQTLKDQHREISEKTKREIAQLKGVICLKEVVESSLAAKLEHIKGEKNSEIARLKDLVGALRDELGENSNKNEGRARQAREDVIGETEDRIANVRQLSQLIEETLVEEINDLNSTLARKNDQIAFLLQSDKKQLEAHESAESSLKALVAKLEDKIFVIQRENELELYSTIERLKKQYGDNLNKATEEWEQIRLAHASSVDALKRKISQQNKEIQLLNSENIQLEGRHKEMAREQEHSVQMLSQKILRMEADRDESLRNYTTSMKQIEDDAKTKLDDLKTAIESKSTEVEIMNAQLSLKNGEISHLLEEIDRLRSANRDKLKKLEITNASEQGNLNNEITDLKRKVLDLKRNVHELQGKCADDEAEHQLQLSLIKGELQQQREANELLQSRNTFLSEWCQELDRDLKHERVANVNILHDQSISTRENVQVREDVRVELEALKAKEVEQLKSVHKLEKARLEGELVKREHELREKKEELVRLMVQYKALEAKVGKSSRVDRSAEDEGKCRATLQAEILLTENIFNAINRP